MLEHIKKNYLQIIGTILAGLTYFEVGPDQLVNTLSSFSFVIYIASGVLIGYGACRAHYWFRLGRIGTSRAEIEHGDEEFRAGFLRCPYWIKVFLKTVLDKETAFSEADSYYFEQYSQFLLQFLDYKTVSDNVWQFSMRDDAKVYFDNHPELLCDVKESDIRQHARRTGGGMYSLRISNGFDWWYYSNDDYMASISLDESGMLNMMQ